MLCSEDVVYTFHPKKVSKSLKWIGSDTYIAELDFDAIEEFYEQTDDELLLGFWCQEITYEIALDTELIYDFNEIKEIGIFKWIMHYWQLGKTSNICAIIGQICREQGLDPFEFFNDLAE